MPTANNPLTLRTQRCRTATLTLVRPCTSSHGQIGEVMVDMELLRWGDSIRLFTRTRTPAVVNRDPVRYVRLEASRF